MRDRPQPGSKSNAKTRRIKLEQKMTQTMKQDVNMENPEREKPREDTNSKQYHYGRRKYT